MVVGGQVLRTTAEHPFWVRGRGWTAARQLRVGDELRSHDGQWLAVEGVRDTGRAEVVVNARVAEYHTYFVGDEQWGFSLWAHNRCGPGGAPQSNIAWTQLSRDARRYMNDIEAQTGLRVSAMQRRLLAEALRERQFTRLTAEEAARHRAEFNRLRPVLIRQWEQNTGQAWPRYTQDVLSRNGTVIRRAGDPFDAHHIIENVYGGPNRWWNIHPAEFPGQHQGGIHRAGGIARELFP